MGKNETTWKEKYNAKSYDRYAFRVRKDDSLNEQIKDFMAKEGTSLNSLVIKLLREYFEGEELPF